MSSRTRQFRSGDELPDENDPAWCRQDDYEVRGNPNAPAPDPIPPHLHLEDGRIQFSDGRVLGRLVADDEQERR